MWLPPRSRARNFLDAFEIDTAGEKGGGKVPIEFRPEFALRSIATRISVLRYSGSNLKSRRASHSVTLPTRRPADNNNSLPPKRALIMVRARAWAGKPAKRSFVETTTRASIATLKRNHPSPFV